MDDALSTIPGIEYNFTAPMAMRLDEAVSGVRTEQVELALDRNALARYGLSVAGVRAAVQAGIGGVEATEIIDGRRRFPVVVRLASAYRGTPEAIGQLMMKTPSEGKVLLS